MEDKLFNQMRPQSLADVKGHRIVTEKVRRWMKKDAIPSFLLLYGCRGCGKTTVARILARVANCKQPKEDGPCGECESCKAAMMGIHPDILELDAASRNKVEDVKALMEKLDFIPFYKKKVVILDEVHRLSQAAFDALLKTLEEPPENVIFIFCTTEVKKIPDTIVSRARKLEFQSLPTLVIAERLKEICEIFKKPYEEEALFMIAKASGGAMRDAINHLEDFFEIGIIKENVLLELGLAEELAVLSILEGICEGDWKKAVLSYREETAKGMRMQSFLDAVISACLDLMQVSVTKSVAEINGTDSYKEALSRLSTKVSIIKVSEICNAFSEIRPAGLGFEQMEGKIISLLISEGSVEDLRKRVEELEKKLSDDICLPKVEKVVETEPFVETTRELPFEEENRELDDFSLVSEDVPFEDKKGEEVIKEAATEEGREADPEEESEEESECDSCPYIEECSGGECMKEKEIKGEEEPTDAQDFFSSLASLF